MLSTVASFLRYNKKKEENLQKAKLWEVLYTSIYTLLLYISFGMNLEQGGASAMVT